MLPQHSFEVMKTTAATPMRARALSMGQLVCGSDTMCCRSCITQLPSTTQLPAPVITTSNSGTAVLLHPIRPSTSFAAHFSTSSPPCKCCPWPSRIADPSALVLLPCCCCTPASPFLCCCSPAVVPSLCAWSRSLTCPRRSLTARCEVHLAHTPTHAVPLVP
jgi:hypothetical protein